MSNSLPGSIKTVVRAAVPADLAAVVKIHLEAFHNTFLTNMGEPFLLRYYELVLRSPKGIFLVSQGPAGLAGFVAGFLNPEEFYQSMRQNRWRFVIPILSALARNPLLIAGVFRGARRVKGTQPERPGPAGELSSIAVRPEGAGLGVGKALIKAFLDRAWSMGARCVYLTTDTNRNEAANAFYIKSGFRRCRQFEQRKGRWMNEYAFDRPGIAPALPSRQVA